MSVFSYFKEEDHRRALYASLVFIMLTILFFLLVSLEEPNPPLEPEIIEIEMPDIIIETGSQGGGSESDQQSEVPVPDNTMEEPAQEIETQEEETVNVTSSNGNSNSDNTSEVAEAAPDSDFSFGGGGSGEGNGSGTGFGSGSGVNGTGEGSDPGDGSADLDRKMIKKPSFSSTAQEEGTVVLDIWVNQDGNVIKTRFRETGSTTGSQYLIGLAVKAAKTMKYSKKSGMPSEHVGYEKFVFIKS